FGDYGSGYIVNKLIKKGLSKEFVLSHISKYKLAHNIDEQKILNGYVNSTYISFTITIESLRRNLEKRGFHWKAVDQAIKQHPKSNTLKTKIQVKAEKTDVKAEIVKMSRRGKGLRFITQVLKSKLVDVSNIEKLANELALDGDVDFYQIATSELSKYASKRRLNLKEYSDKSKAFKYLLDRGFTTDQINYGLDELLKTE
ncbi:TPA: RecX family transcriptional regulator, partial [Vibrio campbellii]